MELSHERLAGAESIELCVNGRFVQVPEWPLGYAFNRLVSMADVDIGFEEYVISVGILLEEMIEGGFEFSQLSCPPPERDIAGNPRCVENKPQSLATEKSQSVGE